MGCLLYTTLQFIGEIRQTLIPAEGFKFRLKIASDSDGWPGQPAGMRAEGATYRDVASRPYPKARRQNLRFRAAAIFVAGSRDCQGSGGELP
ncbi:hypothetical protein ABW06_06070 [Pluralibacter gergoviae]|uniref:Uncharacterized protein n=1 Tax=Pluralibacter gergoviae TaxID=61647 RepID=A0A0J5LMX1_PLUGE|nr:hypothetical protein ABW06_06070 [Pluralibacter gergoviae]KMK21041.1 hypothetical protein ABW10_21735 [Pluralibacter gergoviae]